MKDYPCVTDYHVTRHPQYPSVYSHQATIRLDEARSFDISCVSPDEEKDIQKMLSLSMYAGQRPAPDTSKIEDRVTDLQKRVARIESLHQYPRLTDYDPLTSNPTVEGELSLLEDRYGPNATRALRAALGASGEYWVIHTCTPQELNDSAGRCDLCDRQAYCDEDFGLRGALCPLRSPHVYHRSRGAGGQGGQPSLGPKEKEELLYPTDDFMRWPWVAPSPEVDHD